MRVAAFAGFDGPDDVTVQETDDPEPNPTEVVLDVAAASINRHDLWILEGDSAMVATDDLPFVSGLDVAGEIAETGADVDSVSVGDRVVLCPNQTCGVCQYCREGPRTSVNSSACTTAASQSRRSSRLIDSSHSLIQ